jgi:hypothetical protein
MMVEPTKLKPRRLRSLETASDSALLALKSAALRTRFCTGLPATNAQMYASKEPCSACTRWKARALPIADAIFWRLRTMPGSCIRRATSRSPKRATRATSKSWKAAR